MKRISRHPANSVNQIGHFFVQHYVRNIAKIAQFGTNSRVNSPQTPKLVGFAKILIKKFTNRSGLLDLSFGVWYYLVANN